MRGGSSGWTLALDTATPATVAAAQGPDGRTASRAQAPDPGERPDHTRLLLGLAGACLRETGGSWSTVTRVVVGLGPGTFTGIRVGVATGRAIALATAAPTVGLATPTALAAAAQAPGAPAHGEAVLVVQDARRRELFLSLVGLDERPRGAAAGAPWAIPRDALATTVAGLDPAPTVAVGDGALQHREELEELGLRVPVDPAVHAVDGRALLRAADGAPAGDAGERLRPIYVRAPDAVPTAERVR